MPIASLCLGQIGERADLALPLVCGKTSTDNALQYLEWLKAVFELLSVQVSSNLMCSNFYLTPR